MYNEDMNDIILLEKNKRNSLYNRIGKKLNDEREQKAFIGKQLYRNAQKSKAFNIYFSFNTAEKYKEFFVYIYEQRLFLKYGGMVYDWK